MPQGQTAVATADLEANLDALWPRYVQGLQARPASPAWSAARRERRSTWPRWPKAPASS